jgi:hypothetical protein
MILYMKSKNLLTLTGKLKHKLQNEVIMCM